MSDIVRELRTTRPRVERYIDKALELGPTTALTDVPRRGHTAQIPAEVRAWVVSLARQKARGLGLSARRGAGFTDYGR